MEKTMLAPSGGKVSRLVRRCAEGIEYWLDEKLFTEEQITKMTRAAATCPIPSSLFEFAAQTFAGVTNETVDQGVPEAGADGGAEHLAGKKLFTEEQLAEVAQEIEAYPTPQISLDECIAQSFAGTIEKMAIPKGSPTIKFRRYPSPFSSDPAASMVSAINAASDAPVYKNIIEAIRTLQHAAWENSKAHGWNEAVDNPASALMMITREVSELAEEERDASSGESTKIPGFSKKEEEAADIAIRLLSYCGARNMRLGAAICAKHEFNKTRPYRHGDKLF